MTNRLANLLCPNLGDVIFSLVVWIVVFLQPTLLFRDGSIGWHIATGQWILVHHTVPQHDLFSYTFGDKPWVAYEWLFDLILAILNRIGGLNLIQAAASLLLATLYLKLYEKMRSNGTSAPLALVLVIVGMIASMPHWLARPHLITFVGVFLFSTKLDAFYRATEERQKSIYHLPLFMLFWVNCHPGFLIGIFLILIYFACALFKTIVVNQETRAFWREKSNILLKILGLCLAASFINPYGISLWRYLKGYLQNTSILSMTQEYMSPVFHGAPYSLCLEILFASFLTSVALSKKRLPMPSLLASVFFFCLALAAIRHIPLFVIVVLLMVQTMAPGLRQFKPRPFLLTSIKRVRAFNKMDERGHFHVLSAFAGLLLVILSFDQAGLVKARFDPERTPTDTLNYLKEHRELSLRRGFNFDNWGGIIAFKLNRHVFIDDRADFYGEDFCLRYASIVQTQSGFQQKLEQAGIDWILFPRQSDLVYLLKTSNRWQEVCADRASSLLVRLRNDSKGEIN